MLPARVRLDDEALRRQLHQLAGADRQRRRVRDPVDGPVLAREDLVQVGKARSRSAAPPPRPRSRASSPGPRRSRPRGRRASRGSCGRQRPVLVLVEEGVELAVELALPAAGDVDALGTWAASQWCSAGHDLDPVALTVRAHAPRRKSRTRRVVVGLDRGLGVHASRGRGRPATTASRGGTGRAARGQSAGGARGRRRGRGPGTARPSGSRCRPSGCRSGTPPPARRA